MWESFVANDILISDSSKTTSKPQPTTNTICSEMKKSIIVVLLATLVVLDKNIISAEQEDVEVTNDDEIDSELRSEEELFLFFMFSFFALCVSLFGSFLLYISYLDDSIMKLYADEGNFVEGEVVATEFTRGVDTNGEAKGNYNSQKEYFVTIEYSVFLSATYPIRIRKQLRVLECDFLNPGQNSSVFRKNAEGKAVVKSSNPKLEIDASQDSFFKSFQFDHGRRLQLLVLPDYHLSALPACQVTRRLSTRYRLSSITFVAAAIFIAVFCFRLAAPLLEQQINEEGGIEASGYISYIMGPPTTKLQSLLTNFFFAMLALTPILCIHHLLHGYIQHALEWEYFESGGEVIKSGQDDSSLSSRSFGYNRTNSDGGYNRMDF